MRELSESRESASAEVPTDAASPATTSSEETSSEETPPEEISAAAVSDGDYDNRRGPRPDRATDTEAERSGPFPGLPLPPLALLTLGAALLHQFGGRFFLRMIAHPHFEASRDLLGKLARTTAFLQILTVLAGIVSLGVGLGQAISPRSRAHPAMGPPHWVLLHRTGVAVFTGVLMPMMVLLLVLPPSRASATLLRLSMAASAVLIAFLTSLSARPPMPVPFRLAMRALVIAGLFGFAYGILRLLGEAHGATTLFESAIAARRTGEVAFLVALLSLAVGVLPRPPFTPRVFGALVLGALASAVPLTAMRVYVRMTSPAELADVLYGATHFELLLGVAPFSYGVVIGLFGGVAVLGLAGSPVQRRGALAMLALLAAGYAPTTAPTVVATVLGYLLVIRAQPRLGSYDPRDAAPPGSSASA